MNFREDIGGKSDKTCVGLEMGDADIDDDS